MKVFAPIAVFAAVAMSATIVVSAGDVTVQGGGTQKQPMAADSVVRVATHSGLNDATALINKNKLAMANNVMITRSNVVGSQNDRLAMDMEQEQNQEQAIQSNPQQRAVNVLVGTKDMLRQPTGIVNKNVGLSDNQFTISRSHIMPTQNDRVTMLRGAKMADVVAPASAISMAKTDGEDESEESEEKEKEEPTKGAKKEEELEKKKKKKSKKML